MGPKTKELKELCQKLGRKYVGFRGNPKAPIWIVGEAPGADEDQAGVPFVGSSGRELDRILVESGLSLSQICFVNPYKVRPPNNELERFEETGISFELSQQQFLEELGEYRPTFICPVGGTSLGILCEDTRDNRDHESKISKWRGSILASPKCSWGHYIIPNFHPAYILREWSDRDVSVFVNRRIKEEYDFFIDNKKLQPLPERELIANPSFGEARDYLLACLNHKGPISLDIELLARRVPICIAASFEPRSACSVSFFDGEPSNLALLWRLLERILREKQIVGQNWSTFDSNWMEALGFSPGIHLLDDTLVLHHVLHPELSHKLDFQVMQYTREPFYKDEGKGWQLREGLAKLKKYNCKDSACTLEVFFEEWKELNENPSQRKFYEYEMSLARAFHRIDKKGVLTNSEALAKLRQEIIKELDEKCISISSNMHGRPVVYSAGMGASLAKQLNCDAKQVLNISSVPQLKEVLTKELKIKLKTNRQTGKESTGEESLNEAFAATGNGVLKDILRVRELNKVLGTYVDSRLGAGVLYSCYSVTGTVTGRRSSRKNFLGLGTNGQNQPKHSDLGERFQSIFTARPGHIFVYCDQASAEEWIVQGIIADVSGDKKGIQELKDSISSGISRHARLASQIFGLPLEKTNDKECLEYYVGKKVRHAGNYGMQGDKMAAVMASEGFPTNRSFCDSVLTKFHQVEPNVQRVFHRYVEHELTTKRMLSTPLGRERTFHGLRPYGDNGKIFREGYAYIPQSTVGDNNGLSILFCEANWPSSVVLDGHDSCLLEVPDTFDNTIKAMKLLERAYDRIIRFPNGFEVKIPIDYKIGYTMKGLKKCPGAFDEVGLTSIAKLYAQLQSLRPVITSGAQLAASPLLSNDTSGLNNRPGECSPISTSSLSDAQV